jgi:hypothetical protein
MLEQLIETVMRFAEKDDAVDANMQSKPARERRSTL